MKKPEHSETAHFTFMRGQPFTTGHAKVLHHVMAAANKENADHHIFLSHTQDAKKNPLSHEQKVHFASRAVPGANIHTEKHIKTPIDALKHLHSKGYKHVVMHVGEDRLQDMHNLVHAYNGKEYKFHKIEVKSVGHRDPDAEGTEGMSGTKMREHAAAKNFKEFSKGVAHKPDAKAMMHAVRKGMKLEDYQAVILCGGPGSGKDFILREALADNTEIPLGAQVPLNGTPVVLNGNAQDYDQIVIEAANLEAHGYDVAMIYVYTSDEVSQMRNESRRETGAKTITEAARAAKYAEATKAMAEYHRLFGSGFLLFDNSADFRMVNEETQEQINIWLNELCESMESFFKKPIATTTHVPGSSQYAPVPKDHKRIKDGSFFKVVHKDDHRYKNHSAVNEDLNDLFEKAMNMTDLIVKRGTPNQQGDKYKGGITRANTDSEQTVVEATVADPNQDVTVSQSSMTGAKLNKKKPAKSATPPSEPNTSLIGTVPGVAFGVTESLKTFSQLRRHK